MSRFQRRHARQLAVQLYQFVPVQILFCALSGCGRAGRRSRIRIVATEPSSRNDRML